jgi:spore germination protein GerM
VRSLAQKASPGLAAWWPWTTSTVTLYFSDGRFFVPVSRRMTRNADLPRATLQALIGGPTARSGLKNPVPEGVEILSFDVREGVAHIDLSSAFHGDPSRTHAAETAIVATMAALPGVRSVSLSVEGKPFVESASRAPLLYYASANGLLAVPVSATTPRAALTMYLSGPPDRALTGLPSDVRLLSYEHDPAGGSLSLNLSYTPSVRTLALEQPERMRMVLLGLITGLTEFSSVRTVRLDFEGQTRLGLGQCSDLLRTPQPRPELLNDERLLER